MERVCLYDVVRYWDDCDRTVLNLKPLPYDKAVELYLRESRPARYGSLYSWAIELHKYSLSKERAEMALKAAREILHVPDSRKDSTDEMIYFLMGVEWGDGSLIDKMYKWIDEHLVFEDSGWHTDKENFVSIKERVLRDFREDMSK